MSDFTEIEALKQGGGFVEGEAFFVPTSGNDLVISFTDPQNEVMGAMMMFYMLQERRD